MHRLVLLLFIALLAASCAADGDPAESLTTEAPDAAPTVTVSTSALVPETASGDEPTGELSSEITFDTTDTGCGGRLWSQLHLIEVASGAVVWSNDTPWAPNGPVVLGGDTVVLVDRSFDRPAAVGYDLATGDGRWQRTWNGSVAELVATDGTSAAVMVASAGYFRGGRFLLVDADGSAVESPIAVGGVAHNDQGPVWWQSRYVIGPDEVAWDPFAEPARALEAGGFSDYQPVIVGEVAVTTSGSRMGFTDGDTVWETTLAVDDEFTAMSDIRVGSETVLVLLGSELGPDRRLSVFDRADGSLRWTLDGIRDADVAGQQIIYDRRTSSADGNGPTREVFMVDQFDPSVVAWSAVADKSLGGFMGRLDGRDHFFHQDAAIFPRAPYPEVGGITEVQIFEPELRIVDGSGPDEIPMLGGDRDLRRAPGPDTASGPGWTAVTIGEHVWLTSGAETQSLDLGSTPRHLLATDAGLLATTGTEEFVCD